MKKEKIKNIAVALNKLQIERNVINEQRADLRRLVRGANVQEITAQLIRIPSKNLHFYKFKNIETGNQHIDVVISDMHYRGRQDDKAVEKLFTATVEAVQRIKRNTAKELFVTLAFLGDDIEGELHLSSLDKKDHSVEQVQGIKTHYLNLIFNIANSLKDNKHLKIAFVPESNHGQVRLHGMGRGEKPRNDFGYILKTWLKDICKDNFDWYEDKDGVVETEYAFFMHGDKPFMNNSNKVRLKLGIQKDIIMGHFHRFKATQHQEQYLICAPVGHSNIEDYIKEAGYDEPKASTLIIKRNNKMKVKALEIVEA